MSKVSDTIKQMSKLTKEEWREYTKTVWHIANTTHNEHPAVFPIEIPHRLIKLFSWHGETVLDPFAGIGTTARSCRTTGPHKYFAWIKTRNTQISFGAIASISRMDN